MEQDPDAHVEFVFGKKLARGVCATDWKFKEISLKKIYKAIDKATQGQIEDDRITLQDLIKAGA